MRYVKKINYDDFYNIVKYPQIFKILSPRDLTWNIDINECINNNKIDVEIIQKNNMVFALVALGNEFSTYNVYCIVYVDPKNRLRAYIPKYGNLYNPWTISHFGNESPFPADYSLRSITKMPKQYYELDKKLGGYKESKKYRKDFEKNKLKEDKDLMIKEFLNFFKLE